MGRLLPRGEDKLREAMRYAVLGPGKRFRPLLVLAAAEAFGADASTALPFACGVEFIHAYSLVHDDLPCMDDDDVRRGRPSCHKVFGEGIALLAGDALLTMAFEIMAGAGVPARLCRAKSRIVHEAARFAGLDGMIGGQLLDITYTAARPEIVEDLMRKKTGALITFAVRAGGLVAGASKPGLEALTVYGDKVGIAFQIRDDIFDASERSKRPGFDKPNSTEVFGAEGAEAEVASLVRQAQAALCGAAIESPALRHLARRLLRR